MRGDNRAHAYDNMTACVRGGAKCAQLADCSTAKHELQLRCMDLTKNTDDPGIYISHLSAGLFALLYATNANET